MKRKANTASEALKVKGFYRLNIVNQDGSIAGDTGWKQNIITNTGYLNFLCNLLGATTGSSQVGRVVLGTGGLANATDTALPGELTNHSAYTRATPTVSVSSSKTVQFLATFASSVVTANANISNIGLVNATSSGGNLFAGNTYTSSTLATNQAVNVTYAIAFA